MASGRESDVVKHIRKNGKIDELLACVASWRWGKCEVMTKGIKLVVADKLTYLHRNTVVNRFDTILSALFGRKCHECTPWHNNKDITYIKTYNTFHIHQLH